MDAIEYIISSANVGGKYEKHDWGIPNCSFKFGASSYQTKELDMTILLAVGGKI